MSNKDVTWAPFSEGAAKSLASVFCSLCGQAVETPFIHLSAFNWSAGRLGQHSKWCEREGERQASQGAPGGRGCLASLQGALAASALGLL